ncbi:DUF4157 domain-containing protein [Gelidibacter salicanalis]|uniref:DUF4157 domain-containing protein n=1 Tax=Gelidibacter salicanalis TaxID=291193 RepID=A0A5C7AGJ2_9FLAO|nr:DUF4157 domain-containing protein [Gelidibacter salicanalis]TXE07850.1 DUF4157 domain-containing protein [Gelidibacter salicanalis]
MLTTAKHKGNKENQSHELHSRSVETKSAFVLQQNKFNRNPFDFNQIPLQAKLQINTPGDPYEQEADRIADKVVNMKEVGSIEKGGKPQIQRKSLSDEISNISSLTTQRKCSQCEEEEEEVLQRKSLNTQSTTATSSFNSQLNATRGKGSSMDASTNQFMSSRFGIDFSGVNIHSDDKAAKMSRAMGAKAFTSGKDIYFNSGEYKPQTHGGKELLAHELVHTVQQGRSFAGTDIQRDVYSGPTTAAEILEEINRKLSNYDLIRIDELVTNFVLMSSNEEKIEHGIGLVGRLLEHNLEADARNVLDGVSSAFMFAFAVSSELLNNSIFSLDNPIESLIEQANRQEAHGNNDISIELLRNAFYIAQILVLLKTERLDEDISQRLADNPVVANASFFGILGVMLYYSFTTLYNIMRNVVTFYIQKQRQAQLVGNSVAARQYDILDGRLNAALSEDRISFSGSVGRGLTVMSTIPTTPDPNPELIGANNTRETIRPLPGTPRPDEIAQHPYYSIEMPTLLNTIRNQELLVNEVFAFPEVVAAFPGQTIDWESRSDRIKLWNALYDGLVRLHGTTNALPELMHWIQRYLQNYTFHTEYDIRDFGRSYLDSEMPTDLIGRVARDCGVYAVTVAYEIYRIARHGSLNINFRIYTSLDHVILIILDAAENRHFVLSNDVIDGPNSGVSDSEIINSVGNSFAAIGQTQFGVSPILHNDAGNSSMGDRSFQRQAWNNFRQIGHQWGLRDREVNNPETSEPESLTDRHYQDLRAFNQRSLRTVEKVQRIEEELASATDAMERNRILQRDLIPLANAVITDLWPLFMRLGECADIATTSRSLARRSREFVFNSGGAVHPLVQVAIKLLQFQNNGGVLEAHQNFFICSLQRIDMFNSQLQTSGFTLPACSSSSTTDYRNLCQELMAT